MGRCGGKIKMKRLFISILLLGCLGIYAGDKVDINKADKATLEKVKGIGSARAQNIIDYRNANGPFASVDDLQKVSLFGKATVESLKPMLSATQVISLDPGGDTIPDSAKLNINTATAKELDELPGIGEVYAKRIIAYRTANGPFKSVEDLLNVEGVNKSTLEKFASKITVGNTDSPSIGAAVAPKTGSKIDETGTSGRKLKVWRPKI